MVAPILSTPLTGYMVKKFLIYKKIVVAVVPVQGVYNPGCGSFSD
jgi:hypothetical protein